MNKKLEYHKEYPETVYKDRVYKWFTDSTSDMSDAELQRFVDLCMRGNLTSQCADEIDINNPDIDIIEHLLMDIASEKNNELIYTYTDEIDWDNDYIEKYNTYSGNIDRKKLESRIARLEKLVYRKIKNEQAEPNLKDLAKEIENSIRLNLGRDSGWIVASRVGSDAYNKDFIRIFIEGDDYEISDEHCLIFRVYVDEDNFEIVDEYTVYGHTYRAKNVGGIVSIITSLVNNYFADRV